MGKRSFADKGIIAFTHIKKCAGTTLEHILRINFFMRYCEVKNLAKNADTSSRGFFQAEDMGQVFLLNPFIKCIAGHTLKPFGSLIDYYPNIRFITLLRDPIKRYVSQFYSTDNSKDKRTFEQYLDLETIKNKQTKTIAGKAELDVAKQIIHERFLLVGVVEEFDEFLIL
jgi:hypothetical protein